MRLVLLFLVACGGKTVDDSAAVTTSLTPCTGAGEQTLVLGSVSGGSLEPWSDGSTVALGGGGLRIDLEVTGVDASDQVNAVVSIDVGGVSETAIGGLILDCEGDGPATGATIVALPDGAADAPGTNADLTVTITDPHGASASTSVGLVFQ